MYIRDAILKCILTPTSDLSNIDPFDKLQDIGVSDNSMLQENAASAYNFFLVIGIIGLAITVSYCGLKIAWNHQAAKKSEAKSELGFKIWLALGLFSFSFLLGIVLELAQSLT